LKRPPATPPAAFFISFKKLLPKRNIFAAKERDVGLTVKPCMIPVRDHLQGGKTSWESFFGL
jgi:hypothetical protein